MSNCFDVAEASRLYQDGLSLKEIGRELKIGKETVRKKLSEGGVTMRPAVRYKRLSLDESFFECIDTEEKAYWLGFVMADGNVYNGRIQLRLASIDKNHVEKFAKALNSGYKISERTSNGFSQTGTDIHSKRMAEDLSRLGVVPNKSLVATPPHISDGFVRHFMRGIIDGDGCLSVIKKTKRRVLSLVGSELVCLRFSSWVESLTGYLPVVRAHCGVFRVEVSRLSLVPIVVSELYDKSTISLDRKMVIAKEFMRAA